MNKHITEMVKTTKSFYATIHMAGDIHLAKNVAQQWAMKGACVQFSPVTYVYKGGREEGFTARFINYPRFPKEESEIYSDACELAERLIDALGQLSYTIETTNNTFYFERPGSNKAK